MDTYEIEYRVGTSRAILLVKASSEFEAQCIAEREHGIEFGLQINVRKISI